MNKNYFLLCIVTLWVTLSVSTASLAQAPGADRSFQLTSYEVHLVKGKNPYQYRTEKNELKKAGTAWLVLLNLQPKIPVTNSRIDFYIGDYRIPEYGSTKTGLYFRIYDPALLARLNNQPISWQSGSQPKKTFAGKPFLADAKNRKVENEEAVLPKNR